MRCDVCFRHCELDEGRIGFCRARICRDNTIEPLNYGQLTSLALDPIEKKPLYHFYPGSAIVSAGSFGCNLACPFCQNVSISLADKREQIPRTEYSSPEELVEICADHRSNGNIGIAFTYNEPLINYEYILEVAKLIREQGMKTVLVTNGSATTKILDLIGPYIDAMNIDLKSFDEEYYKNTLRGDLAATKAFIEKAIMYSHIEVTTLIIPGENDSEDEMRRIASYLKGISEKNNKDIPLHISRFFPRSEYSDRTPTPVETVYRLADVAREYLPHVHEGNC